MEEIIKVLKDCQSRLCEHCPPGDLDTNCGEHIDECLAAMELIEKLEKGTYDL